MTNKTTFLLGANLLMALKNVFGVYLKVA